MKKSIKYTLVGVTLSCACAIIVAFSTSWTNMPMISIGGSSAVSPLITAYSNIYNESDIVVQAGGSGVGISSALDGRKNIGMASKNPKGLEDLSIKDKWIKNQMKTITIAWDGIGIVYNPYDKEELDLNENNIELIYNIFAGQEVSWSSIVGSGNYKKPALAFARDGGALKSGTADAFLHDSHFNKKPSKEIEDILVKGNYGKYSIPTAESNVEAWGSIESRNIDGSLIYLSAGFILNNKKEIEEKGFKIATYNGQELSQQSITAGYNWYRPFNLMTSLNTINDAIKKFIEFTITTSPKRDKIIQELGFVKLTDAQTNSMKDPSGNLWVSDEKLQHCGAKSTRIGGN